MRINYFIVNAFETAYAHIRGYDSNECQRDKSFYYANSQSYSAYEHTKTIDFVAERISLYGILRVLQPERLL